MGLLGEVDPHVQRLEGEACYLCDRLLPPRVDLPRVPRTCPDCPPRPCHVHCYFSGGLITTVCFVDLYAPPGAAQIGPWLVAGPTGEPATEEQLRAILRWGHLSPEAFAAYEHGRRSHCQTSTLLHLTPQERASLIERGRGWPWNGFELLRMYHAGLYPPQRLDPYETADYHRRQAHREQQAQQRAAPKK